MANDQECRIGSINELARIMLRERSRRGESWSRVTFLIGAGCSVSAGIPLASNIAREQTQRLGKIYLESEFESASAAYNALVRAGHFPSAQEKSSEKLSDPSELQDKDIDWGQVYDHIFEDHIRAPDEIKELFGGLVDKAKASINWAHLCIGELVRTKHVSTVISTNFDQLVLTGMVQAGIIPAVCDGLESLNRVDPDSSHPQLIEIHGSRHTYMLRNALSDVSAVKDDTRVVGAFSGLLGKAAALVVVGYAGREAGVMNVLVDSARHYPDKEITWVTYSQDPSSLSGKARDLLATSRNARLIIGQDADAFFMELCRQLGVGAPLAVREPLALAKQLAGRVVKHALPAIHNEVSVAREMLQQLDRCLANHLKNRSETDSLLKSAQDLLLAGKAPEAFAVLRPKIDRFEDARLWLAFADAASQTGATSADRMPLEESVQAYEKARAGFRRGRGFLSAPACRAGEIACSARKARCEPRSVIRGHWGFRCGPVQT